MRIHQFLFRKLQQCGPDNGFNTCKWNLRFFCYHLLSMACILAAYNNFLQDTEEAYFVIIGNENDAVKCRNEHFDLVVDIFCDQGLTQT